MAIETFANFPSTTVPAGASGTVSSGQADTWVVSSQATFGTAATGVTKFHVADTAQAASSELILVTNMTGAGNTTWSVIRGAENTTPVAHGVGFTITQVIAAGWLNDVATSTLPAGNTTSTKEFLTSTGSGGTANTPVWGTIAASDVPLLNQNTTGTASNVTGTVAVGNGGTGLNSLATYGIITGGTASTTAVQQIAAGTAGQVLTSNGAGTLPTFKAAPVDWLNVVTSYGADPTGGTDSTLAIQGAITAALALSSSVSAGGITAAMLVPTVYFPQGNYLISSALTFGSQTSLIRMTGNWGSRIFSNASGIIDFQNIANQGLEVDHLTLDATGGHIFTNPNLKFSYFHHLNLIQRSPGYAVIDLEQSGGAMQECAWTDIQSWALADAVAGTRSIAAVKLYPNLGATVAGTTFERWQCNNYPGTGGSGGTRDSTQYCFDLACTAASTSSWVTNITFSHITFNHYFGGCIKVRSGANIRILGCKPDNLTTDAGVVWANAAIYIGKDGSAASTGVRIHDYQRGSGALPTPGSEPSDIYTESTTTDIMVDGASDASSAAPTGPQINLNGAAGAVIQNADSGLTVLNPGADTIRVNYGLITAQTFSSLQSLYQAPAGAHAETYPRWAATALTGATGTGTIYAMGIPLAPGVMVSNITLVNGTAAGTVSHGWYGLLDSNLVVRAASADQGSGTWGTANTAVTLPMVSPYTTPAGGLYFIAWSVTATGMPTWYRNGGVEATILGLSPVLCGSSSTVSGTPPSIGATLNSLTASGAFPVYAYVT